MAFEPLETDEPLKGKPPRREDVDRELLAGCSVFLTVSVGSFVLFCAPFFVLQDLHTLALLGRAMAIGGLPVAVIGAVAVRSFGIPAACGLFGGSLTCGIFLVLRLAQVQMAGNMRPDLVPEYPAMFGYLLALAWVITTAVIGVGFLPRQKK